MVGFRKSGHVYVLRCTDISLYHPIYSTIPCLFHKLVHNCTMYYYKIIILLFGIKTIIYILKNATTILITITQTYNNIASYTQCKDYKQTLAHASGKIVLLKFIHQLFKVSGQRFQSISLKILYHLL